MPCNHKTERPAPVSVGRVWWIPVIALLFGHTAPAAEAPLLSFAAPDGDQGVAVDAAHVYVIDNKVVAKHDKCTGALVQRWVADEARPLIHMNSGMVRDRKLYCAHSNYPGIPMTSSVEVWDTETLEHVDSHSFGIGDGSLTWMDWRDGSWWGCFAHYEGKRGLPDRGNAWTTLVRFDAAWQRTGAWVFPPAVLERFAPHSCSGGAWGPDGLLYVSGHDRPELYALRLSRAGSVLEFVATVSFPSEGQAIAFDRTGTGLLYGLIRSEHRVVASFFARLPRVKE